MKSAVAALIQTAKLSEPELWIAGPASDVEVVRIETLLGQSLPPSFRVFVMEVGGISLGDLWVSGIVSDRADEPTAGNVWSDTVRLREEFSMPEHLLVVSPHEDGAYCLDLAAERVGGESPVVNFEPGQVQHDHPVATDFVAWLREWFLADVLREN